MSNEWMRVSLALLLVLGFILLLSWLIKRLNGVNLTASKGFQLIASMTLGPREKLMLILVGGQYLLLGLSAQSVNLIHDFGQSLPEGFDAATKPNFTDLMKSALRK